MKKPVALLLGLAALGVAGAETAAAQGLYYYGPGYYGQRYYVPGLAPWRVARIVRSAGLTPLSAPARRGPIYEVVAIDPEGRHMRVAVDAYRGAITSVRPVAVLRPNSEPYGARGPNGEPYGSRIAVAPPDEETDMAPSPRLGPPLTQPGAGRIPPQALPPYAGPSQPQHTMQPPQAAQPAPNPRIANAPPITGATTPVETQRTPIPRPRPSAAATAAVTPAPSSAPSQAPAAAPSAAATAPAEVPEAPPAPIRARPSTPAAAAASAAAASASAKAATPAAAANASAATGNTSKATAKTEPRPPTTLVPVAPLE